MSEDNNDLIGPAPSHGASMPAPIGPAPSHGASMPAPMFAPSHGASMPSPSHGARPVSGPPPPHGAMAYQGPVPRPPSPSQRARAYQGPIPPTGSTPTPIDYAERYRRLPGQPPNPGGRAYTAVDRIAILPNIHALDHPAPEAPPTEELKSDLVAGWLEMAKREHASIASFALFAQKLMAVGAPLEFITEAFQCAQEEVQHARLCFEVVSVLSGRAVEDSMRGLEVSYSAHRFEVGDDVRKVFEETLAQGCVMETLGALDAARKADLMEGSPFLHRVWKQIALDEAHHCEFAWKVVDWVIKREGEDLKEVLKSALRRELEGKRGEWPEEDIKVVLEVGESLVEKKEDRVAGHTESLYASLTERIRNFVLSL